MPTEVTSLLVPRENSVFIDVPIMRNDGKLIICQRHPSLPAFISQTNAVSQNGSAEDRERVPSPVTAKGRLFCLAD